MGFYQIIQLLQHIKVISEHLIEGKRNSFCFHEGLTKEQDISALPRAFFFVYFSWGNDKDNCCSCNWENKKYSGHPQWVTQLNRHYFLWH